MARTHLIFEMLGFNGFLHFLKVDDLKNHRANYTCVEKGHAYTRARARDTHIHTK
jgi:hypothetical protein